MRLWSPELHTILKVRMHQCLVQHKNLLFGLSGCAVLMHTKMQFAPWMPGHIAVSCCAAGTSSSRSLPAVLLLRHLSPICACVQHCFIPGAAISILHVKLHAVPDNAPTCLDHSARPLYSWGSEKFLPVYCLRQTYSVYFYVFKSLM